MRPAAPLLVAHADWSASPGKRWLATATQLPTGEFIAHAPQPAGDPGEFIPRLRSQGIHLIQGEVSPGSVPSAGEGVLLLGFDFPIGLPLRYAHLCEVSRFLDLLPQLGSGIWESFYIPADSVEEIHLRRPFYPRRAVVGDRPAPRHRHLLAALGMEHIDDLRRLCERAHPLRRAASPLFWTLGGQQVGKASISGWREVLAPALRSLPHSVSIWPFSGPLFSLLTAGQTVIAEAYPGEFYHHLGVRFTPPHRGRRSGKRAPEDRQANAPVLLEWARRAGVRLTPELQEDILRGFGTSAAGEDPFDAVIGLFGMINVLLGHRSPGDPPPGPLREIEGWILGQEHAPACKV